MIQYKLNTSKLRNRVGEKNEVHSIIFTEKKVSGYKMKPVSSEVTTM